MFTDASLGNSMTVPTPEESATPSLKVLVIYETVFACLMAKLLCERMGRHADDPVTIFYCSYALLNYPDHYQFAQTKARQSDMILLANSEKYNFPQVVDSWLNSWMVESGNDGKAMVGVFGLEKRDQLVDLACFRQLKSKSAENGFKFFGLFFPLSSMGQSEPFYNPELESSAKEFAAFLAENHRRASAN